MLILPTWSLSVTLTCVYCIYIFYNDSTFFVYLIFLLLLVCLFQQKTSFPRAGGPSVLFNILSLQQCLAYKKYSINYLLHE